MNTIFKRILADNTMGDWLAAATVAIAVMAALYVAKYIVIKRIAAWAPKTHTKLDDLAAGILNSTRLWLLALLALYAGAQSLALPAKADRFVTNVAVVALLLQCALWAHHALGRWLADFLARRQATNAGLATASALLGFVSRVVLWSLFLLLILDNLGFNITTLIAGVGIGGIAVALAAQHILGDLFAALSIALDKPFVVGDFIIVGDIKGTIEDVGLKTTRIRSLWGELILLSNADLLKSQIRNYKRMLERRIEFKFGVVYDISPEALARIPGMVREAVEAQPKTRFDRAHFKDYGEFALNFEVVFFVLDPDYNLHMDIQQAINLTLFRRFQDEGIMFAFPTRTLYLRNQNTLTPAPDAN